MRIFKTFALSVAVLGLLLAPAAFADCGGCGKKHEETKAAEGTPCSGHADHADHAEHGDHAKAVSADCCAKDGGCEHRNAKTAELASKAKGGCSKSAAKLVKMAQKSGCPKGTDLAARAMKGDEKAEAELIAMFVQEDAEK